MEGTNEYHTATLRKSQYEDQVEDDPKQRLKLSHTQNYKSVHFKQYATLSGH